ncbi:AzlC family ABC transporter permease [Desulfosporosinus metallidurans]|uniref:AzlC family protein n=1 Tax=Desulfosporosinus metallidurans TaxID=1888891 RepID=A0A1Q8QPX8_9FIRM|nr:AzlC family ABC transporter permease [Desulfosporosinus metallidurans]OLN29409.1 AzlC family protein [Desulfosporosinus metallidurans]
MNYNEFLMGIKKTTPLMVGVIPFGLAYGIMGAQAGLKFSEITLMSIFVFAGSAQFMAVGMIKEGISFAFIVFSTLLINLRHLLMGLSLAPYLNTQKRRWLYLLAFGMVDESYASTINHYQESGSEQGNPYFMVGAALGMYIFWIGSSVVGGLLGHSIKDPLSWGLDFAMPATFLSILVLQIKSARMLIVFLVSGITAIAAYIYIPGKWYIIIATVAATATGAFMELTEESRVANCEKNTSS